MKINIVVVGLGFGSSFVNIFQKHPNVGTVGIFDTDKELMNKIAHDLKSVKTYERFEDILKDDEIDAVHLVSPIFLHEEQSIAVLKANKHCACTVPMATSLDGIRRITEAKRSLGKNYMMMETTLYTYQFFYIQEMLKKGEFGRIQFMRGSHYQDMSGWPDYWMGLPPMYYGTHAIGPMVALSGSRISRVVCLGSGTMDSSLHTQYGNPFPVESALFSFENGMKGEATRTLFETVREYQEGLFIYGSEANFEWGFRDNDAPYVTRFSTDVNERGKSTIPSQIKMPNYAALLPEPLQTYTLRDGDFDPLNPQLKGKGGGHHGSHPHLVHEFVMSIVEGRKPWIDEIMGGNITAAGICAHESAMKDGTPVIVPLF
ncbi:MAG: Gfo/Idh/MocA family oxidoreductase [Oscillospiraceae bacterium]|nr:Gfo/Idh/MocA family oxidoreductase [Oscillospiraceae bacterium]